MGRPLVAAAPSLCEALRENCRDVWQELLDHPFVRELAAGTLPPEKFRFYVQQDLLFLEDYARAIGLAVGRTAGREDLRLLVDELRIVVEQEIESQWTLLRRVEELAGPGDPAAATAAPTTLAYADFLLATAARGDAIDVMTALMPCAWSYADIGLARLGGVVDHPVYADFLRFFAGSEYVESIAERRAVLDRLASGLSDARRRRLSELFTTATRLELAFWEMAYVDRRLNTEEET